MIYGLCLSHAKICYVSGNDVIISDPKTLTAQSEASAIRVAYGRNVKYLEISRHLGKESVPQIIASTYDKRTGKAIHARWPRKLTPILKQSSLKGNGAADVTGIGTIREQTLRITPPASITDPSLLEDYCRAYYDNLARHEGSMRFATKALRDLKGDDILVLRPGDPVRVEFDAFVAEDLRERSESERYSRLREIGYSDEVAAIVAVEFDRLAQFQAPFYCKDITFSWSISDGLSIDVEGINFISPKRDAL